MKIFVSIASYKDPLLWDTVNSCLSNSKNPQNIKFGIIDQSDKEFDFTEYPYKNRVSYIHINPIYSRGPCWARSIVNNLYNNEDFVLQIDSHTVFDEDWDIRLISSLQNCLEKSQKAVISSYPRPFELTENGIVKHKLTNTVMVFSPVGEAAIHVDDPTFMFSSLNIGSDIPILGYHIAGGFIFAPGKFFQEIPYDPNIYFLGEEQNIAIRAWTHGWDIYQIPDVPLYHLYYKRSHRSLHWDQDDDKYRVIQWVRLREISKKRMCNLIFDQKDLGVYSLGKIRSLKEFSEFSGINYIDRIINRVNNSK